jgi:predicted membrane chloride channel (bestrophin family)
MLPEFITEAHFIMFGIVAYFIIGRIIVNILYSLKIIVINDNDRNPESEKVWCTVFLPAILLWLFLSMCKDVIIKFFK